MSHQVKVNEYLTLVFDCDGVILDSNRVKTEAFYQSTLPYGEAAAQAMVKYHVSNGGVSRYKKFAYFLNHIAPDQFSVSQTDALEKLLETYACHVCDGLLACDIASDLEELRRFSPNSRWLIVSGGDQAELREVFSQRGISEWFDGGIFGSPDTKDQILQREIASKNIQQPALFLGDSKYDYQAASAAKLDFVFLSGWTEVEGWKEWCHEEVIFHKTSIEDLMVAE